MRVNLLEIAQIQEILRVIIRGNAHDYPIQKKTVKPANRQTGKPANRQTGEPANRRTGKPANCIKLPSIR